MALTQYYAQQSPFIQFSFTMYIVKRVTIFNRNIVGYHVKDL